MMIGEMIALIFAGHLGDSSNLAVMGLAHSTMNIIVMSVMVGVNAAQETLTSQSFGAGKLRLCGMYLNRGQAILSFFFALFAGLIAAYGDKFFYFITKDEELSHRAIHMIRLWLPFMFLQSQHDLWKRWLACQRVTFVPMVACLTGVLLQIPLIYLFMYEFNLGLDGIPIA